jgi:hypothetical protein
VNGREGAEERRKEVRRSSDRILEETVQFNRILLDILEGRPQPFLDYQLRLHEIRELLGRREADRLAADELMVGLERIVRRLVEMGVIDKMPRKVRICKVEGQPGESFPSGTMREGWEKEEPQVGKRYCLYQDSGKIYRTGTVQRVAPDEFQTGYSIYRIEVLDGEPLG